MLLREFDVNLTGYWRRLADVGRPRRKTGKGFLLPAFAASNTFGVAFNRADVGMMAIAVSVGLVVISRFAHSQLGVAGYREW